MQGNHPPDLPGLTLLVGMAGIGKTALALIWAHRSAEAFPDGRLYVDLKGFAERGTPMSADEAVRVLLDCLGVPDHLLPATAGGRIALYRAVIADKRVLIVLDNVHHADQVRPLLPPAGPAQVLATSRNALASLVTIDLARTVALQPLSALESRELLNKRLGPERTAGREDAVAAIAEHCAHLPLALVVAAGRAWVRPDVPLEDLAAQLGAVGGSLGALDGGDAAISVRTVLSWSYCQLSACAARLYRLLALHPGPDVAVPAAASLAALPSVEAHAALVELVAMNMASVDGRGRYRRHSLLEAFAAERLAAEECEEERDRAYRRMVDHYLRTVVQVNMLHATTALPTAEELAPAPAGALTTVIEDSFGGIAWFDAERRSWPRCWRTWRRRGWTPRCGSWRARGRSGWRETRDGRRTSRARAWRWRLRAGWGTGSPRHTCTGCSGGTYRASGTRRVGCTTWIGRWSCMWRRGMRRGRPRRSGRWRM
ncbi:hypothetical protein ACFQ9X_51450 [Catenulispora yoronensis]